VADFLDAKVKEIEERLQELRPLIEEYHKLEAAAAALGGIDVPGPVRGRPVSRNGSSAGASRRGRPRGSRGDNTRAAQAIELVRTRPGITIPELAEHMGIKPNYLYRILPQLEEEGKVQRKDKGWLPAA
jgi:predicted Rossmann fold nucleotide-binding protein DprA/Smf involved in DNA uptake